MQIFITSSNLQGFRKKNKLNSPSNTTLRQNIYLQDFELSLFFSHKLPLSYARRKKQLNFCQIPGHLGASSICLDYLDQ